MNRRGGILPAAMLLGLAAALLAIFFTEAAALAIRRERAVTACDFALLSALRIRRDNLELIAGRWASFGADIRLAGSDLEVDAARWPSLWSEADALRRALPGYQGRVTSALTVSLDANAFPRDAGRAVTGTGLRLGVAARSEAVSVGGLPAILDGAWYARDWAPSEAAPAEAGTAGLTLNWPARWRGADRIVRVASNGGLEWDADPADPLVLSWGRGGFARHRVEATDAGDFSPHRFPVFRAISRGALP